MAERNIYLDKKDLAAARKIWRQFYQHLHRAREKIAVREAGGRFSAAPVRAERSAPHFNAAAMDGIAVRADQTRGINERNPGILVISRDCLEVNTGDPLPQGFNAVIKIEDVELLKDNQVRIYSSAAPWQHVRTIGESVLRGELLITSGQQLKEYHIGALLEAGIKEIEVYKPPRLGLLATGDEIIPPEQEPGFGEIVDFNSAMISSWCSQNNIEVDFAGIIPDDRERISAEISDLIETADFIIIIAGSSAGKKDFIPGIVAEMGEVILHGVDIAPGKPVLLGSITETPVIGLPGYPLSCLLDFHLFAAPALNWLAGRLQENRDKITARIKRKIGSRPGRLEFLRANLFYPEIRDESSGTSSAGVKPVAVPRSRGAAAMKSILQADGLMLVPADREGLSPGEEAEIILLEKEQEIKKGLLLLGSNDPLLESLQQELQLLENPVRLKIQSRGSQAGLHALVRGECQLATSHLLDPETGDYNIPYLRQIAREEYCLLTLAWREQGLLVARGNPCKIEGLSDLADGDISFINRQRGAGTRILLDYQLDREGIEPGKINGYQREEYTHAAVAQAVSAGTADVGLGIKAMAEAFGLDFVPLTRERFEVILPARLENSRAVARLKEVILSSDFLDKLENRAGYQPAGESQIRYLKPRRDNNGN